MTDGLGCGRPLRNSAIVAMVLAGCATAQNTPLQDYVWEMGRNCNAAGITMTKGDPDGRYHLTGANVTSFSAFTVHAGAAAETPVSGMARSEQEAGVPGTVGPERPGP